jgi:putative ABC transport system substrate-binding protein
MKRRHFIALLGGAAATWTLAARAQQTTTPVVAFLSSGAPGPFADVFAAFLQSLGNAGYVQGKDVAIEVRWAEGQYDQLPGLAAELVRLHPAVIVVSGGAVSVLAAKVATPSIPIVFVMGDDPIKSGLVTSFNRPGGNVTGISLIIAELMAKRVELLAELAPSAGTIAVLVNPHNPNAIKDAEDARAAAHARGRAVLVLHASSAVEIDASFAALVQQGAGALVIGTDIFFTNRRAQLVALAAGHHVPTIYQWREFVQDGGLVSYGTTHAEPYRQAAGYAARILNGEKPGNLSVTQPTKFELIINLKTAKALGLEIPPTLLATADEVIE